MGGMEIRIERLEKNMKKNIVIQGLQVVADNKIYLKVGMENLIEWKGSNKNRCDSLQN